MKETLTAVADRIMAGYRLQKDDAIVQEMLTLPLEDLQREAGRLQKHFCGNHVDFCTIINARSGRCGENCKYCAQAACHHTDCEEYGFLPKEEIMKVAKADQDAGANRFSLVTSGRALTGKDFEKALDTYQEMHKTLTIDLCASHGILSQEQFHRLVQTGVTSYHHNIETSRRYFPQICTSHTYDDRIRTIKAAQAEGLCVCSGGIIGMGETWQDRLDMAFELQGLGIESIPINALMPIPGTGMEGRPSLPPEDILRTIAIFRFINPTANIRLAAGRKLLPDNGKSALLTGASASITGNMLTTSGTTIAEDMEMLAELGLTNR
ncbi:biotin synthase BioB [Acidaminococcus sp. NSJ-142]|jgi:biotin synthase|uniref:biotin synthase BioB n=1 Tax=Acidaminococcus TaxID=904 RepID=UPI000CF9B0CC|nr:MULTISPECIES: biotin synthase BioB [Acidaminococcus]MCD2434852.1 biotin synthase BioB [Acidaminococcus hominis]MCH4095939.1 biotin synthase BioB [Acidaminococcus provencensis]